MKAAIAIGILFVTTLLVAGQTARTTTQIASPASNLDTQPVKQQQPCIPPDDLLKYQQFLRIETESMTLNADRIMSHVDLIIKVVASVGTLIAGLIAFLGVKTNRDIRSIADGRLALVESDAKVKIAMIESEAKLKIEKVVGELQITSRDRLDARINQLEVAYQRRQMKYFELIGSYFFKLFETNPDLCSKWVGKEFADGRFNGKRILWVDDDPVGIAMFTGLLKRCGIDSDICGSTSETLARRLANYNLIVSNLRRGSEDNAGLLMTESVREKSKIPIIIFTRPQHRDDYGSDLRQAGASAIATSDSELFPWIAQLLERHSPANLEV